jgi:hypothetical protein
MNGSWSSIEKGACHETFDRCFAVAAALASFGALADTPATSP